MYCNKHLTAAQLFQHDNVVKDIRHLNQVNGIGEVVSQRTIANLGFISNALAGEVGELANVVKKLWRDGESQKHWEHFGEECCDVLIYLIMLIDVSGISIDKAWEKKFRELQQRFDDEAFNPRQWLIDQPLRTLEYEDDK